MTKTKTPWWLALMCWAINGGHRYGTPRDQNWRRRETCVRCFHEKVTEIR